MTAISGLRDIRLDAFHARPIPQFQVTIRMCAMSLSLADGKRTPHSGGDQLQSSAEGETMGNLSGVVEHLKKELERAQREVHQFTAALAAMGSSYSNGRRTLSASARKRISLAQKKRWAKARGQASKPKRTLSASARRKIAAAQRARWAKVRAQQKKAA